MEHITVFPIKSNGNDFPFNAFSFSGRVFRNKLKSLGEACMFGQLSCACSFLFCGILGGYIHEDKILFFLLVVQCECYYSYSCSVCFWGSFNNQFYKSEGFWFVGVQVLYLVSQQECVFFCRYGLVQRLFNKWHLGAMASFLPLVF